VTYEQGTCGFCGTGDGHLGEQGDETSQTLHGSVRTGHAPDWEYKRHPNADDTGQILWCGQCVGGLHHKFQRYDDHNLRAKFLAYKVWNEMDGPRWALWEASDGAERDALRQLKDDMAVHAEKLYVEREVQLMQDEQFRRAGFDLTTRGWLP
jgi:hypothetical protein